MNNWDKLYTEGAEFSSLNEIFLRDLLERITRRMKRTPKTVIDLGCGTGDSLVKFGKKGLRGIGVDFSTVALKKAKERLRKEKVSGIKLIKMDLDELDLPKNADLVFSKLTFAFIRDRETFLQHVKTLMKKDSLFVLMTPVLHKGVQYTKMDKPGIAVDFKETKKLLAASFRTVEMVNHDYFGDKGDLVTFLASK